MKPHAISMPGLLLAAALPLRAGDLDPPVGPVMPTMKRLTEIEPRRNLNTLPGSPNAVHRISEPGSYYLTASIRGEPGKHGIEVVFAGTIDRNVSIDLNGFSLEGVPGSLNGIQAPVSATIRNGSVVAWGGNGIEMSQGIAEGLRVQHNTGNGLRGSWGVTVRNCTFEGNNGDGISAGDNITVQNCLTKGNDGRGIHVDGVCIISECVSYANDGGGISTFGLGHVTRCTIFSTSPGIVVNGSCRITENQISSSIPGILAEVDSSRIEDNLLSFATIKVNGAKNLIVRNHVSGAPLATAYEIAPGNLVGPISTDPATAGEWANFHAP